MDAVALAARKHADLLLLVGAQEVERGDVAARVHRAGAQRERLGPAGDLLPDGLLRVEAAGLVGVGPLDGLADPDGAAVGLFLPGDHLQQGGLAGAVRPDHADDGAGRDLGAEIVQQQALAVGLADALQFDDDIAQARAGRDVDLQLFAALLGFLAQQAFVGGQAGLALGLARLGATCGSTPARARGSSGAWISLFSSSARRSFFCSSQEE